MLYSLLKFPAKLAFLVWCRDLRINKKEFLNAEGPLLIAANHPNSFLDAVLLATIFNRPVYSLARGDAFTNKLYAKILRALKMFPVYRISEGAHNLEENYSTFDECIKVFKQGGIVLIFSEGACVNEWNLRPLKKGTARLILQSWSEGIPLKIIPTGINYSSFSRFSKNIILNFGEVISITDHSFAPAQPSGARIKELNEAIKIQLEKLVIQIKPANSARLKKVFETRISGFKKALLFIPAILGYAIHAPLYIPVQKYAYKKFGSIDHYNSVLVGMLFFFYPFYLLLISLATHLAFGGWWWLIVFLTMPFTAWSSMQLKEQV